MKEIFWEKMMKQRKAVFHWKGITYFDKKTERTIFFILTIIMLIWGLFEKFGFSTG